MLNRKLHLLVASIVLSGFAQADDYASPSGYIAVSDIPNGLEEEFLGEPMSCKEARETAWFVRELARTDGDTNPDVAYGACPAEVLAASTVDQD